MKLPTQVHGPVTLSRIDVAPNLSEETNAFTAVVEVGASSCPVRNDGHGGETGISDRAVYDAIQTYTATLPPEVSQWFPDGLEVTPDYLIDSMVEDAFREREDARMVKRGFDHVAETESRAIYTVGTPTPMQVSKTFGQNTAVKVRRLTGGAA